MSVEKGWDDLWIAVKFQSNPEIAGSPRNSFRASLVIKMKQPRPSAKVPKCKLSGKGCGVAQTARTLAQKQPFIQRVRNSSLVEWLCAEDKRG